MEIKRANYILSLSNDDAEQIGQSINDSLVRSIVSKYRKMEDGRHSFYKDNKKKIKLMKYMLEIVGKGSSFESYLSLYNKMLKGVDNEE